MNFKLLLFPILIAFIAPPFNGNAQKELDLQAVVTFDGKTKTKAYIDLLNQKAIKPHPEKQYYYYTKGNILSNQGGYTGKLLQGKTEKTAPNGQLFISRKILKRPPTWKMERMAFQWPFGNYYPMEKRK